MAALLRVPLAPKTPVSTAPKLAALGLLAAGTAAFGLAGPRVLGSLGFLPAAKQVDLTSAPVDLTDVEGPAASGGPLGINLVYQAYWSSQFAFVDLFAQSSEWLSQEADGWTWDTGVPLATDPAGWVRRLAPGQAAGKLMARGLDGRYPGGLYHLEWDGLGRFQVLGDGKVILTEPNHLTVRVNPTDGGIHLKLVATEPDDPVRNVRFVHDDHRERAGTDPFDPAFLAFLEPFGTLRFMDWQRTNGATRTNWGQRVTPESDTQAGPHGVALEHCIGLGNRLHKDVWLCVPHLANDEYVRNMAELAHRTLDPDLVCHVEYSNEVWNGQFEQALWSEEQGLLADLAEDPFQARLRFYAQRASEVFGIWREVYGESSDDRLVCVLAGQAVNPWTAETILGQGPAAERADAYAIAPYFGATMGSPEEFQRTKDRNESELFEALDRDLTEVLEAVSANVEVAAKFGLPLLAYEAGQHLAGHGGSEQDELLTARFLAANRDPRMGALYQRLLETWAAVGGRTVCLWNSIETYSKWGSWGLVEFVDTPRVKAPKLDAALRFAEENQRWW